MDRNEAIAWIDEECTNIDPRDKDYVDAMKAIRDLLAAPTEVDDEEVEAITGELESAALALPARSHIEINGEYYPLNVCTDAAEFIRRLHTQLREQGRELIEAGEACATWAHKLTERNAQLKLAKRQRNEAMATLSSLFATASPAVREVCRASVDRICVMSTTTGEKL